MSIKCGTVYNYTIVADDDGFFSSNTIWVTVTSTSTTQSSTIQSSATTTASTLGFELLLLLFSLISFSGYQKRKKNKR